MKNWTIAKRITFGFIILTCVATALGVVSLWSSNTVSRESHDIGEDQIPTLKLIDEITLVASDTRLSIFKHISSTSPEDMKALDERITKDAQTVSADLEAYEKRAVSPEDRAVVENVKTKRTAYREKLLDVLERSRANTNNAEVYNYARAVLDPVGAAYNQSLADALKYEQGQTVASVQDLNQAVRTSQVCTLVGLVLAVLSGLSLGFFITRSINTQLKQSTEALNTSTEQVNAAVNELSTVSQGLASGASQQAASLEETSASLEEISAMTKRNSDNAASSKTLSQQARESAANGLERIAEMGRTLTSVQGAVGEMESAVSEMQASSEEIAKIIKTIDEIAFQTNLLALNAAVEAARAGEAGAGFAVVADEVRSLAQRSAQAAKDTSEKIESAVKRSALGGTASKKVVQSLGEIEGSARNIEQVFNGIVTQIKSLDEIVGEISAASKEQSQGIGEVNMAVGQMDKVTQSNAASAEENASAAEELNAQVGALQNVVTQLQTVVSGASATAASRPAPQPVRSAPKAPKPFKKQNTLPAVLPAPGFARAPKNFDIPMPEAVGSAAGSFNDF